jgi:hypothetical protein
MRMKTVNPYGNNPKNGRFSVKICPDGHNCKYRICNYAHPNMYSDSSHVKYSTYCRNGNIHTCNIHHCEFSHSNFSAKVINNKKRDRQEHEQKPEKQEPEKQEKQEKPEQKEKQQKIEKEEDTLIKTYTELCETYCNYIKNISNSAGQVEPGEIAPIDIDKLRDNYCILRESYNNLLKSFSFI